MRLYAAGSLTAALTEVGVAFRRDSGLKIAHTFGASGLLRERIEKGEPAEVFASANMEHPSMLAKDGKAAPVVLFARHRLCDDRALMMHARTTLKLGSPQEVITRETLRQVYDIDVEITKLRDAAGSTRLVCVPAFRPRQAL